MQPWADQPLSQLLLIPTIAAVAAAEVAGDHLVEKLASGRARCGGRCALAAAGLLLLGGVDPKLGR